MYLLNTRLCSTKYIMDFKLCITSQMRENPYQVLQVTLAISERAMKSKVRMIKSLSPNYQAIRELVLYSPMYASRRETVW